MTWSMSEADVRHASPTDLSRLASFAGCHPDTSDLESLQNAVMDHCDVVRHVCKFVPTVVDGYRICWGCGEVTETPSAERA